jgi:hypothetical protein
MLVSTKSCFEFEFNGAFLARVYAEPLGAVNADLCRC